MVDADWTVDWLLNAIEEGADALCEWKNSLTTDLQDERAMIDTAVRHLRMVEHIIYTLQTLAMPEGVPSE